MNKYFLTLGCMIFAATLLFTSWAHAGLDACSFIKTEEVTQIMGTPMRGAPVMDDRCYFLGEGKEFTLVVTDKASYERVKQSPTLTKMGMKIEPLAGVSPEAIFGVHPNIGGHDFYFPKGANAVRLEIKTGQGLAGDTAAAQALGKLIIQRMR